MTAGGGRRAATVDDVFPGTSALAALCRAKDWGSTALGPVERWPQSLKTAVSIVLGSSFPMIVLWGPELVQIYNDGYRLLMGDKHPAGLGQGNRACWPEVWHINEGIYPRVFQGETISFKETMYPLAPHGQVEEHYLTLCYNPVRDESGAVGGVLVTVFDVSQEVRTRIERDRALAEAKAERNRLNDVFQQAPAAIMVTRGPSHVIEVANPLYARVTGDRPLLGKTVPEAFPDLVDQGFPALYDQVLATRAPYVGNEALVRVERFGRTEETYFNFVYQPLIGEDGSAFGVMTHAIEVTDMVRARQQAEQRAAELARLSQALEQSNRELDRFAYVTSHDLKAPLRGIASLAQWIQEDVGDQLSPGSQEHVRLLLGRVHRMEALIDGILAYSRAGRVRESAASVDTAAMVKDSLDLLAPPEHVRIEVQPGLPTLTAERVPLQQVFMNLLGNAIKYSALARPDPLVRLTFRPAGDAYEFAIADNGPGIAPAYHDRIWGIFQTLEARDKVEGAGIGLSVVKKIIETRGGRVWVESALGEGATFRFTWPT
ncbi:hypothetical protein BE11_31035 [Sorangium cellulosum]|nr:hypothetical protein BE11_31035 [Sorangium cellulosum]